MADVEVAVGFRGEAGADDGAIDGGMFGEEFGGVGGPFKFAGGESVVVCCRRGGRFDGHGCDVGVLDKSWLP